jgi:hypothetical protein
MADTRLELHSLVICDYALTAQDGKISAIGIFGQITVGRLPSVHGQFFIVAVLEADPGTHELSLQVVSPSGEPLLQSPPTMTMEVPPNTTTANIVADVKGLQIRELGRHRIELRAGDRVLGTTPFNVNLAWAQQQAGNA